MRRRDRMGTDSNRTDQSKGKTKTGRPKRWIFFAVFLFLALAVCAGLKNSFLNCRFLNRGECGEEECMEWLAQLNDGALPECEWKENGTLHWFLGRFSERNVSSAEDAVRALGEIQTLLGLENAKEELRQTSETKDSAGLICHFEQVYQGIPIYGSMV